VTSAHFQRDEGPCSAGDEEQAVRGRSLEGEDNAVPVGLLDVLLRVDFDESISVESVSRRGINVALLVAVKSQK